MVLVKVFYYYEHCSLDIMSLAHSDGRVDIKSFHHCIVDYHSESGVCEGVNVEEATCKL